MIFLFGSAGLTGQTGKHIKYRLNGVLHPVSVVSREQNLIINYSASDLDISEITNVEGDFYRISIPGHNSVSEPGKPELPVLSRLITLPEGSQPIIKISNVKSEKVTPKTVGFNGLLYPHQYDAVKSDQVQKQGFAIDKEVYKRRGLIKSDTVRIELLGKIRNNQVANLYIYPVRYNPLLNEMEVITSMTIEITFAPGKSSPKGSESAVFTQTLDKGTLNFGSGSLIPGYSDKPVKMIILTDTSFRKGLEPFIEWKTQKGFSITSLYKGAAYAGTSFTQIKDTLTKIYRKGTDDDPAPEYLLIVGDINRIPRSEGSSFYSDLYWGEFDGGSDYLPDMLIGRLPVADTTELKTVVGKLLQYEKFEFADSNKFYNRALATTGDDGGYATYMNGQVKYAVSNYLNPANKITGYSFYYPKAATSEDTIKKLINGGVSFINYTGHGDATGWLDPQIKVPEIALFHNKNMYPFVISNACQTGRFDMPGTMGVKMVVSENKGAIGYIGCSADSYWDEDYFWAVGNGSISADPKYSETGLGALDRLFHTHNEAPSDWYVTMGQVNYAGNMAVSSSTSSLKKRYWETYTLLGDPSVIPYIGTPDSFNISLPDTLPNGIKSYSLTTDPFAYVAVSHFNTLWDASYASPSGNVVLDMPGLSNDSCLIVITGQNKVPLTKKIYFADINREFINLGSVSVNDASANNNGKADYGEFLFLNLTINNLGLTDASQVTAILTTTSNLLSILNDTVLVGTIAGKSQVTLSNNFGLKIADMVTDRDFVTFNLKLKDSKTEKDYIIDIQLHSPVLGIPTCTIDDTQLGNGDFIADPGESVNMLFKVSNTGSSNASGLLNITNIPPGVTINQPSTATGVLLAGETITVPVSITLSPTLAKGSSFNINSTLDCSPYILSKSFSIPVGKTRESFENQSFKIFPWGNSKTYPWIITDGLAYEGNFAARSASISHSSSSVLSLKVNIPVADTMRFYCKVSSEAGWDFLYFRLNGKEIFKMSGEVDWVRKEAILTSGYNLLEWEYRKDVSVSSGSDCAWLDYLTFPVTAFAKIDIRTAKIITPETNKNYGLEKITARVVNLGTDTLKAFNLSFKVNERNPVNELFNKTVAPGDSTDVMFSATADLIANGIYNIIVYGQNNSDSYLNNDTARVVILNTAITPVENPDTRILIMPNPFKESFRIRLNSESDEEIRVSILDALGKLVYEETRQVIAGENILTIVPENLTPGYYTLKIKGKSFFKASRIIKV